MSSKEIEEVLLGKAHEKYDQKETLIGAAAMRYHERMLMLQIVDSHWKDHLLAMDHLKEGIGLRGYGQRDPLVEYKKESYELFEGLMGRIEEDTLRFLFLLQPVEEKKQAEQIERNAAMPNSSCLNRVTMAAMRAHGKPNAIHRKSAEMILVRAAAARNSRNVME